MNKRPEEIKNKVERHLEAGWHMIGFEVWQEQLAKVCVTKGIAKVCICSEGFRNLRLEDGSVWSVESDPSGL